MSFGLILLANINVSADSKSITKKPKENQVEECKPNKSKISHARTYCISEKDILELGVYKSIKNLPDGMLKEIGKKCKTETCIYKKAGKKMYEIFVRRGPIYHARLPGEMIKGMAWYELVYYEKLKKTQKVIEKYNKYSPEEKIKYSKSKVKILDFKKHKFRILSKKIDSLIKMNKGRKNMREAMGMSLDDDIETVIKNHWVLGEFLNNDKLKVKKVILDPEIKKRKLLLEKYQATLKKYKLKLEEEKNKKKKL
jgi:hypothetical protein